MKPQKQLAEEAKTVQILNMIWKQLVQIQMMKQEPWYDLQGDVFLASFRMRKIVKLFKFSPVRDSIF